MRIAGFQALSLLDYPETPCAIIFTQGCLFRCVYCHNPELVPQHDVSAYTEDTVIAEIQKTADIIEGVCVTGGEPTLQPDLPRFLGELRKTGLKIKLDTNGVHPHMIEEIITKNLADFFAMDLKHVWEKYGEIIDVPDSIIVDNCKKTKKLIEESGVDHEFRTTIYPKVHSADDIVNIASTLLPNTRYALQPIRYGKTLKNDLEKVDNLDYDAIMKTINERFPTLKLELRQ